MEMECQNRLRKRVVSSVRYNQQRVNLMSIETMDIMERAEMLPIDMKLELVDRLLESISPSHMEVDEAWKVEVERRIDEVESEEVELIPGEEVFAKIRARVRK